MLPIQSFFKRLPVQLRLWLKWLLFVVCLVILVLTLTELNSRLLVNNTMHNDFIAPWYGFRAFLVEGENPYGAEMQERILEFAEQEGFLVQQDSIESFLKVPLYGIILYLPFLFIRDVSLAFAWWMTALELAAVLVAVLGVSLLKKDLKKNAIYVGISIFLMIASLFFFTGLAQGSGAILSFLLLFTAVKALQQSGDELTGVLLALMTVFPFYGWIGLLFILIWSARHHRMKVLWWFVGTLVLFGFAVALLEPQWLLLYLRMVVRLFGQVDLNFLVPLLKSIFPETFLLPWFIFAVLALLVIIEWAFAYRKDFVLFYWTFHLTLIVEAIIGINLGLANVVFLPTTLIFLLLVWEDRWKLKGRIVGGAVALFVTALPWVMKQILGNNAALDILWIVLVVIIVVGINLYWIRWWLFRNVKLWFAEAYSLDQPGKNYEQP